MDRSLTFLHRITQSFSDIVYPSWCLGCSLQRVPREELCGSCLQTIRPMPSLDYPIGNKTLSIYSVGDYSGALKELIHRKFSAQESAAHFLGKLLSEHYFWDRSEIDCIVPVPLHWQRYAGRGYNQSVEMARIISKKHLVPVKYPLLRSKKTSFQHQLSRNERAINLDQAFSLHPLFLLSEHQKEFYKDKHILLIDDLTTTGATLASCAQTLMLLKPRAFSALVVARAI